MPSTEIANLTADLEDRTAVASSPRKASAAAAPAEAEDNGTATDPPIGTPVTPRDDAPIYSPASDFGRSLSTVLFDAAAEVPTTPRSPPRDGGRPKRDASQQLDPSQERPLHGRYDGDKAYVDPEFW